MARKPWTLGDEAGGSREAGKSLFCSYGLVILRCRRLGRLGTVRLGFRGAFVLRCRSGLFSCPAVDDTAFLEFAFNLLFGLFGVYVWNHGFGMDARGSAC